MRFLVPAAALVAVVALAGPWLGSAPLAPCEVGSGTLHTPALTAMAILPFAPAETAARLPGLLAVAIAAAILAATLRSTAGNAAAVVMTGLSPAFVAAAGTANWVPFRLLLAVLAVRFAHQVRGRWRWIGAPALIACALPTLRDSDGSPAVLQVLTGALSLIGGPGIAPWRPDLALPSVALALILLVRGAGATTAARARTLVGLAGLLGLTSALSLRAGSLDGAANASIALTPVILLLLSRGLSGLVGWRQTVAAAVGIGVSLVAVANVRLATDVLTPARRVPWDQAARMLAVLAKDNAQLSGVPELPEILAMYATLPGADDALPRHRRLVVSTGTRGGLQRPGASLELDLEQSGYRLAGELSLGPLEPGLRTWIERCGGTPSQAYLRIRRFEVLPPALP